MELFKRDGGPIPDFIAEEEKKADITIKTLAQKHGKEKLERCAIAMQRMVRGHQRRKKELLRVMKVEMAMKMRLKSAFLLVTDLTCPNAKIANWLRKFSMLPILFPIILLSVM